MDHIAAKQDKLYDVIVVGGGPVGLATAYEVAKAGKSVLVLEKSTFYNSGGSSGDMVRMFRTMYTEDFMAKLAIKAMGIWNELERDAGVSLRWMSGLLNFGDPKYGGNTPEGTLMGPTENMNKLGLSYKKLTAKQIEESWPFKNLNPDWMGLYAPDNGVINVTLLLRTLSRLAIEYGAETLPYISVQKVTPTKEQDGTDSWRVDAIRNDGNPSTAVPLAFKAKKLVLVPGAYINHILAPSFKIGLDLDIWEMTASYFNVNPGPGGTVFPSMWFQFSPPTADNRSQLFYGFPTVEWGPPNQVRIAVDAATDQIKDPLKRKANVLNPKDIADVQDFVRNHVRGADAECPAYTAACLQTNVFDNMFVLDYVPEEYLQGGAKNSVAVFTAGWAMKFVPLLGKALKQLVVDGESPELALKEFKIARKDKQGKGIIVSTVEPCISDDASRFSQEGQAEGSHFRQVYSTL